MSTAPSAPLSDAPAEISPIARVFGALFNPVPTFESIARRPDWILPLALLVLLGTAVGAELAQRVDWEQVINRQMDASSQAQQLSAEQRAQRVEVGTKVARGICCAAGILGSPILLLIFSGIYLGAFNVLANAGLRFEQSVGIVAHALMPSLISSVLAVIVLMVKDPGTIDPNHPLATDLYAFLPADAPKWLQALGSSLELFFIWILVLVAIGFAAANPRKVKRGTAFALVFGLWGVWVLGKVIWALL